MTLADWIPAITTTSVLALSGLVAALRFGKGFVERAVQHGLDAKLEEVRTRFRKDEEAYKADLRVRDEQITALRSGALSGMATRQETLAKRRLLAAERLWNCVIDLAPLKTISLMASPLDLDAMLARSEGTGRDAQKIQAVAKAMLGPTAHKHDPAPDRERPFLSPITWSLFTAYRQVLVYPLMVLTTMSHGVGGAVLKSPPTEILDVLKAALPELTVYIDKWGASGLHHLVQPLEDRLLKAISNDITGAGSDGDTVAQALDILAKVEAAKAALPGTQTPGMPAGLPGSKPTERPE